MRNAVKAIDTPYVLTFLDDYFINATVDNDKINEYVDLMEDQKVDFLNLDDGFDHILRTPDLVPFNETLVYIPKHLPYGVDTAAAIWSKQYLLDTLGEDDYSAWQFELDRCIAAKSDAGIPGLILCDKLQSLNVSKIPVIIQGAYYPPALKDFKKRGYIIDTADRHIMSCWEVFKYKLKLRFCHVKHGRKFLKWIGHHVFGFDFVSND